MINTDDLFLFPRRWIDEESRGVTTLVRQWADKEIITKRLEYREKNGTLFAEKRRMLALDIGLQKLMVPDDLGGFGWNSLTRAPGVLAVLTEIGRADATIGVSCAVQYAILSCFMDQNKALLGKFASSYSKDEVRTPTLIPPGPGFAGQNTPLFKGRSILAAATPDKQGYTLAGSNLRPLFAGTCADLFCTVCADQNGRPCIALIPGDAKGLKRGPALKATGLNALENADVSLDKVRIPEEAFISREGAVEGLFVLLNLFLGGVSLGAGMNFFEILSDWCDSRVIKGGVPLKENPLCASVIADTAEELALSRLLLFDLAQAIGAPSDWGGDNPGRTYTYAMMIGSRVQQAVLRAINRGLELMGSAGYAKEWHAEKHWRDVKTIQSLLCGVGAEAPVKMDTARFFYGCKEI
jgi:alkylation response protein AidB-like acyl-CoA dehydrogenase